MSDKEYFELISKWIVNKSYFKLCGFLRSADPKAGENAFDCYYRTCCIKVMQQRKTDNFIIRPYQKEALLIPFCASKHMKLLYPKTNHYSFNS